MGPRLGSRGKLSKSLKNLQLISGLQWGRDLEVAESRHNDWWDRLSVRASMGPRLGSRGKVEVKSSKPSKAFASMGPRLGSRGKSSPCLNLLCLQWLQWGRDLEVAESDTLLNQFGSDVRLQWGRDLEVAESLMKNGRLVFADSLQWGRDLEVAESKAGKRSLLVAIGASMGPRLGSRGKTRGSGK